MVTTESMMRGYYAGNNKSILLTNVLFRPGAAVVLVTNFREEGESQFEVNKVQRWMEKGEDAISAVQLVEDEEGLRGNK